MSSKFKNSDPVSNKFDTIKEDEKLVKPADLCCFRWHRLRINIDGIYFNLLFNNDCFITYMIGSR